MKKLFALVLVLCLAFGLAACGDTSTQDSPSPSMEGEEDDQILLPAIGFSAAGQGGLEDAFLEAAEEAATQAGYELIALDAGMNPEKQVEDIHSLLAQGVEALILNPADVDSLQEVLEECSLTGVKVINILTPVNGVVDSLIAPNYELIGQKGAKLAVEAAKDYDYQASRVYLLEEEVDSFLMQWVHDSFVRQAEEAENVAILGASHFNRDEWATLPDLEPEILEGVNTIFAQNEEIARAALAFCLENDRKPSIICVGGSRKTLEMVRDKQLYATIFYGPEELASLAVGEAIQCAQDDTYEPPEYIELPLGVASESSVEGYLAQNAAYAEAVES